MSTDLMTELRQTEAAGYAGWSLAGAAADEIERLAADAACERAEKESLKLEVNRLQLLVADYGGRLAALNARAVDVTGSADTRKSEHE